MENEHNNLGRSDEVCQRLEEALFEELTAGAPPPAWAIEHIDSCTSCAALAGALQVLPEVPEATESERIAVRQHLRADARRRRWRLVAAVAASLMVVAGGSLLFWRAQSRPVHLVAGSVLVEGERLDGKQLIAPGRTLVAGNDGARVDVDGVATLSLVREARVSVEAQRDATWVRLESGRVGFDVVAAQRPFEVSTRSCTIAVRGTHFFVEATPGLVQIDVLEGRVQVRSAHVAQGEVSLEGGFSLLLPESRPVELGEQRKDLLEGKLRDDPARELSPLEAVDDEEDAQAPAEPPAVTPPVEPPSLQALLKKARLCRRERDWHCAAEAYEELIAVYADRAEAATALVSLAQIQLDQLSEGERALSLYQRYLSERPDGLLAPEALFGQARALRHLERWQTESTVLSELLRRYPASPYTSAARKRLQDLEREGQR